MSFRDWTKQLRDVKGNKPHWPWLLGMAMADEFRRQVVVDNGYQGNVFLDRDDHKYQEGHTERRLVQTLYHPSCTGPMHAGFGISSA